MTLFCLFTGLLDKTHELEIVPNKVYYDMSFLSDYVRPIAVYDPNSRLFLKPISFEIINKLINKWETTIGHPLYFCYFPTQLLAFYPHYGTTMNEKLLLFYKAWPVDFDSRANIDFAEDCLIYYCVSDLYDQLLETTKSQVVWKKFTDDLVMCKRKISRLSVAGESVYMGEVNA